MSGLSLREARTKRQKANVYKTSRSEFRSTQNSARTDQSPESADDKVIRRKIMKIDEKEQDPKGESSGNVNVSGEDVKIKNTEEDDDDESDLEDMESEDGDTSDEEDEDEDNKDDKKDEKNDKDPDDQSGNDNNKDAKGEDNCGEDQGENKKEEPGEDKNKPSEDDNIERKNNGDGETSGADNTDKQAVGVQGENDKEGEEELKNASDSEEDEEEDKSMGPQCATSPYDEEYEIEDDDSDVEDPYEFLSQDGGSRGGSDASFGGEEDFDEDRYGDEHEEVRGAG